MSETELIFHLTFGLLTFCIIYPPKEFVQCGLTVEGMLRNWFPSPDDVQFIQYQMRRTTFTLFIHSTIPFLYIFFYYLNFEWNFAAYNVLIQYGVSVIAVVAVCCPIISGLIVWHWCRGNRNQHPIVKELRKFSGRDWNRIAGDINAEVRGIDKILMELNAMSTFIVTENWIIKTLPYSVCFAHQSDTALVVVKSDTHDMDVNSTDETVQYVNIKIMPTRPGTSEFTVRLNALDFKDVQDRMNRPIEILSGITFNRTIIERFVEVFKSQVAQNPLYYARELTDTCFACMTVPPNIKLNKQCTDRIEPNGRQSIDCGNCYCRPMWCIDCIAKWFASRQSEHPKEVWLEQKCTCPMCRTTFCILDVCFVEIN